jgi:hypothetical protein
LPRRRLPPAVEGLLREAAAGFARSVTEILGNAVAHMADDALERVEARAEGVLGGVRRARSVAQKRSRRGRRNS